MLFNIDKLSLSNVKEFSKEVHTFYQALDKEKQKYTMRISIVLYDAIRKNTIDTDKKLDAIKRVVTILNTKTEHNENDLDVADNILLKNGMCWTMGNE